MREFSKVYCSLWQSQKFESVPDAKSKLLYLYLLTNQHSNSAGCYDLKKGYAMTDLGYTDHEYSMGIDTLASCLLIEVEKGLQTILITNWVGFNQPQNAKHSLGIMNALKDISSYTLKIKRIQEFMPFFHAKKHFNDRFCGEPLSSLCHGYAYPCDTLETETKTETQTETRPREDLDFKTSEYFSGKPPNGKFAIAKGHGDLPSGSEGAVKKLLETPLMKRNH
jgi:hypothetical protein